MIYDGTGTGWYLVVLGQYKSVLLGFKWYWVSMGLLSLYILIKVEIWLDVTIAGRQTTNDKQTRKEDEMSKIHPRHALD